MDSESERDTTGLGIAAALGGVTAMSVNDMLVKFLSGGFPLHQIIFTRASIAIIVTLAIIRYEGGRAALKSRHPFLQMARGVLVIFANMAFFLGLVSMPLAEATALYFVAPLMMSLMAVPLLGERLDRARLLAVLAGLAGVAVMLRPGGDLFRPIALLPLASAFLYSLMQILTRRIGLADKASTMAFFTQSSFILFSAGFGLAFGDGRVQFPDNPSLDFLFRAWTWPDGRNALLLLALGSVSAVVGYLISQAYRLADVAVVAPFEYAAMPLAVLWGYLVWGDWPDTTAWIGITLILGAGLAVGMRERSARRRRFVARSSTPAA